MIRLDGNTILVADTDKDYGSHLSEVLSFHGAKCFFAEDISVAKKLLVKYEFDLIISNYYLPDGIIHHLIDWCTQKNTNLPIFTCTGYPMPLELDYSHKQSIAEVFSKNDLPRMLQSISRLLFDFTEFYDNLLEMMTPTEVIIEAVINNRNFIINPLELKADGLLLHSSPEIKKGSFGVLKFLLAFEDEAHNLIIPGFFDGEYFKVNEDYLANWKKFINFLNLKQIDITHFLTRASGI
jgi:CheY-like chemotaxis protein